jgi:ABC-type nitrate/sulfonate/bicarbonate transport system substrate-binding protein
MRKFILLVGVISMFVGFTAAAVLSAAAPDKIKFPYSPISWNSLPWWMAKDAGHFEKNGLDVDLFYEGASSVIVQAMLAGDAQFSGIAGPSIVSNVISGGDVIQIAAVVKTFTVPMYAQPQIKSVAELKSSPLNEARVATKIPSPFANDLIFFSISSVVIVSPSKNRDRVSSDSIAAER